MSTHARSSIKLCLVQIALYTGVPLDYKTVKLTADTVITPSCYGSVQSSFPDCFIL